MEIGKRYNWVNQKERLIYKGYNLSGNGYWHQFSLVENPAEIWCECLDSDLKMIEETKPPEHFPEAIYEEMSRLHEGLKVIWDDRFDYNPKVTNNTERNRRKRARKKSNNK